MKNRLFVSVCMLFISMKGFAAVPIHECDIDRIEAGKEHIIALLDTCQQIKGTPTDIPQSNAYTNSAVKPHLWLAKSSEEIQEYGHMLSLLLTAYAAEKRVVLRWELEGTKGVIKYLLIK